MIKLKEILKEEYKTRKLNRNFNPDDLDKKSFKLIMKIDNRGIGGVIVGKIWHKNKEWEKKYSEFTLRATHGENNVIYSLWVGGRSVYEFISIKDVNKILGLNINSSIEKQIMKMEI